MKIQGSWKFAWVVSLGPRQAETSVLLSDDWCLPLKGTLYLCAAAVAAATAGEGRVRNPGSSWCFFRGSQRVRREKY